MSGLAPLNERMSRWTDESVDSATLNGMFGVGAGEFLVLVILGVLLFGPEKVPELARKVARVIHYVRTVANNAQSTIRTELGPGYEDFDISDPKSFIRKHLMDEMDPMLADVRRELDESTAAMRDATDQLRQQGPGSPVTAAVVAARATAPDSPAPFDTEAT